MRTVYGCVFQSKGDKLSTVIRGHFVEVQVGVSQYHGHCG